MADNLSGDQLALCRAVSSPNCSLISGRDDLISFSSFCASIDWASREAELWLRAYATAVEETSRICYIVQARRKSICFHTHPCALEGVLWDGSRAHSRNDSRQLQDLRLNNLLHTNRTILSCSTLERTEALAIQILVTTTNLIREQLDTGHGAIQSCNEANSDQVGSKPSNHLTHPRATRSFNLHGAQYRPISVQIRPNRLP